jgi:hypothetical protein
MRAHTGKSERCSATLEVELMRRAPAFFVAIGLALVACTPHGVAAPATGMTATTADDDGARIAKLREDEGAVLEVIAASDPRFAARVGGAKEERLHAASVKALAMGDADAGIEDGALDFFSFTARARSIAQAEAIVAGAPTFERDASAELERELLVRLVAEEHARLDEERALPGGASALVRGVVETWGAPDSRHAAETRDARIARRLDEVHASLAGANASRVTLAELDDALDPLERIATPEVYGKTIQALTRLRVALGDATMRANEADDSWPRVQAKLRAHLGVAWDARELRARLENAEHTLRVAATERYAPTHPDVHALAERLTLRASACDASPHESLLRALPPPSERAPICGALHALHDPPDDGLSRLAALIALHDDAVVALWSLALHEAHATPALAAESAHLFLGAQPDHEARLVRFAAARPVAAIAAGLTAGELAASLDSDLAARWLAFGDAPFDLATSALAATSSPAGAPASLRP